MTGKYYYTNTHLLPCGNRFIVSKDYIKCTMAQNDTKIQAHYYTLTPLEELL